jgi:hypothetical protein
MSRICSSVTRLVPKTGSLPQSPSYVLVQGPSRTDEPADDALDEDVEEAIEALAS